MNLSRKTILVIISTFIALVFIVAVTSDVILLENLSKLEKQVLKDNMSKVMNEINESYDELDDDIKFFMESVQQKDAATLAALPITAFHERHTDIVAVYSSDASFQYGRHLDFHNRRQPEQRQEYFVRLGDAARLALKTDRHIRGIVILGSTPVQVVARQTAKGGVFLACRMLDREEIDRIVKVTGFSFVISSGTDDSIPEDISDAREKLLLNTENFISRNDETNVYGYSLFNDISGAPAAVLKLSERRVLYDQGKAGIVYVIVSVLLSGAVFCSVMLVFVRGTILKRITALCSAIAAISRQRDISSRLEIKGQEDELDEMALSINSMLDSLEEAEHALTESTEEYRILFERAPDSIMLVGLEGDEAGIIVAANKAAADQHGYTVKELEGMRIYGLNTPESNLVAGEYMTRIFEGEWVTFEVWHFKKDGTRFPIEVHAGQIKIKGKGYVLGFDRDITIRKVSEEADRMFLDQINHLNRELVQKADELAAANKELEAFNYSVSHDLRSPLTRISGYCQLILEDDPGSIEQLREYVKRIYESSCWLDEMIDAMLTLSRLTRGEFKPEIIDMSLVADEIFRELRLSEPSRKIETSIHPALSLSADQGMFRILLTNLLNNAWKYTARQDNPVIEVGSMEDENQQVFFVRDNGAGFNMKHSDRLFQVFARLHDSNNFSGNGIGLAIVQRIVARHGGRIWAEGEPDKGAVFYFTLQSSTPRFSGEQIF